MIQDIFEMSLKSLTRQQIRSFLTLAGVVIGIAAIVCLLSIGQGLTNSVNEQFEQLGTNIVYMLGMNPLSGTSNTIDFSDSDISWVEGVSGVDYVLPLYSGVGTMQANSVRKNVMILSMDLDKSSLFEEYGYFDVEEGRRIEEGDTQGILITKQLAEDGFDKPLNAKKLVTINDLPYKIIGIQKPLKVVVGDYNPENLILMSESAFKKFSPNSTPTYLMIVTFSREDNSKIADELTKHFEDKYGQRSIYVYTSDQLLDQINSIYAIITFFLIGVSAIAMIVGGVGIMNAMITSVMEKTKEIGIMKALGASNYTILMIFIIEAALIGLIGGAMGTILGYGLSQIISFFVSESGMILQGVISLEITLIGLGFSTIVGVISGYLPALRAANLDPIEALRYE
ncbi:MAG: ABC transporter permease [Candidatus ainarchaeum sp.]|jgi:putative ABC transport system permease protein|nr:ABC transporter permease [Candidatus ainarchaeum sp.]MDD3085917.1 ABC transporter permease [Candidatus ainarchaeum sp.]MDD4128203.1 ABC transporter permease [Candidatus ainarchaeum sp.]MDD4467600.1 ABC transporter permease [Candidatus ainarchaeum sp.]